MTFEKLEKLIKEIVKKEIEKEMALQQKQIVTEIKSQLFDLIISSNPPINQPSKQQTSLKELAGVDTPRPVNRNRMKYIDPTDLPKTFDAGRLTEGHKEILKSIEETDFSAILKKIGGV